MFKLSFCLVLCASACAQSGAVEGLLRVPFGDLYHGDGTGAESILDAGGSRAEVKAILDQGKPAIPALIDALTDTRISKTTSKHAPVPLGFLALDILTAVVGQKSVVYRPDCADGMIGACIKPGYFFRPDATPPQMASAQKLWRAAWQKGALTFHDPR